MDDDWLRAGLQWQGEEDEDADEVINQSAGIPSNEIHHHRTWNPGNGNVPTEQRTDVILNLSQWCTALRLTVLLLVLL